MSAVMIALIAAVAGCVGAWVGTNVACWYWMAHRTFDSPWNWRVLLGAGAYARWEDSP